MQRTHEPTRTKQVRRRNQQLSRLRGPHTGIGSTWFNTIHLHHQDSENVQATSRNYPASINMGFASTGADHASAGVRRLPPASAWSTCRPMPAPLLPRKPCPRSHRGTDPCEVTRSSCPVKDDQHMTEVTNHWLCINQETESTVLALLLVQRNLGARGSQRTTVPKKTSTLHANMSRSKKNWL